VGLRSAKVAEEGAEVVHQRLGFLERGEVAPRGHDGPAADVVDALGPRARRPHDLLREGGVGRRHLDALAVADRPGRVVARVVGPEGRVDRARDPVERDVGQELVLGKPALDVAAAVAPRPELLDDPGREPGRRVRETEGQRLGLRALDPLVAGLLTEPGPQVVEVGTLLRRGVFRAGEVAAQRQEVDVDACQPLRIGDAEPGGDEAAPVAALGGEAAVAEDGIRRRASRRRRRRGRAGGRRSPRGLRAP
jgi:hypothetical protein